MLGGRKGTFLFFSLNLHSLEIHKTDNSSYVISSKLLPDYFSMNLILKGLYFLASHSYSLFNVLVLFSSPASYFLLLFLAMEARKISFLLMLCSKSPDCPHQVISITPRGFY
jgi:hypothetical protein